MSGTRYAKTEEYTDEILGLAHSRRVALDNKDNPWDGTTSSRSVSFIPPKHPQWSCLAMRATIGVC